MKKRYECFTPTAKSSPFQQLSKWIDDEPFEINRKYKWKVATAFDPASCTDPKAFILLAYKSKKII